MKIWFVTGSQHLYGEEALKQVAKQVEEIIDYMNNSKRLGLEIINKGIVTTSEEIENLLKEVNFNNECGGVITWMHTFSPSKMWINGLKQLNKPLLHFHTQYHSEIPLNEIDMDFMNLNQAAHGDREHGFIHANLKTKRKVIHGYWKDSHTLERVDNWMTLCKGIGFSNSLKVCRFGDNMRNVAVTEGNKVSAQMKFGWEINTWPVGDLVRYIEAVTERELDEQLKEYENRYTVDTDKLESIKYQAKLNIAMKKFLKDRGCMAFTDTFEDLHGMNQLPGLATQNLMMDGYGFGGEGDWKTAAMVSILKNMVGENSKTSFMEDYTYHINNESLVLGSHMLEVCPSIAEGKPSIEVHHLGIGGKEDPARIVFSGKTGKAIQVSLIELEGRYRLIANVCNAVKPVGDMPNLPVARVMWRPEPSLEAASEAWIIAGGAHHTAMTYDVSVETLRDFADYYDIEFVLIDKTLNLNTFKRDLELNELLFKLKSL